MSICINCQFITECSVYHLVEKQHQRRKERNLLSCNFIPDLSIIKINILSKNYSQSELDWDVIECLSFIEEPGIWLSRT